jgi:hypothetical protein
MIRKLPDHSPSTPAGPNPAEVAPELIVASPPVGEVPAPRASPFEARPVVKPLAEDTFKVQFTARRALRDKLREAQDLMRHRVPDGDLAEIVERGIDLLIAVVKKERFAVGTAPRARPSTPLAPATRHVPDAIKRAVYERDGGRCTFTAADGRRCAETGGLELDHADGFARTRLHSVEGIRLRCRAHNQHAADEMYGRAFMENARGRARPAATETEPPPTRPGASRGRRGAKPLDARSEPLLL